MECQETTDKSLITHCTRMIGKFALILSSHNVLQLSVKYSTLSCRRVFSSNSALKSFLYSSGSYFTKFLIAVICELKHRFLNSRELISLENL